MRVGIREELKIRVNDCKTLFGLYGLGKYLNNFYEPWNVHYFMPERSRDK